MENFNSKQTCIRSVPNCILLISCAKISSVQISRYLDKFFLGNVFSRFFRSLIWFRVKINNIYSVHFPLNYGYEFDQNKSKVWRILKFGLGAKCTSPRRCVITIVVYSMVLRFFSFFCYQTKRSETIADEHNTQLRVEIFPSGNARIIL